MPENTDDVTLRALELATKLDLLVEIFREVTEALGRATGPGLTIGFLTSLDHIVVLRMNVLIRDGAVPSEVIRSVAKMWEELSSETKQRIRNPPPEDH